jgi:hypothetical protein
LDVVSGLTDIVSKPIKGGYSDVALIPRNSPLIVYTYA